MNTQALVPKETMKSFFFFSRGQMFSFLFSRFFLLNVWVRLHFSRAPSLLGSSDGSRSIGGLQRGAVPRLRPGPRPGHSAGAGHRRAVLQARGLGLEGRMGGWAERVKSWVREEGTGGSPPYELLMGFLS